MADGFAGINEGFSEAFSELAEKAPGLFEALEFHEGLELGRQGAFAVFAPLIWKAKIGDRWETTIAAANLGVSRQAIYKRVRNGSLLGVPGRGTTLFPTWQFDERNQIRLVVGQIIGAFRDAGEDDPLTIASWATTEQEEDLDGVSPAVWITQNRDSEAVVRAARRAANRLAA
jgi:hypothetical protein